jgi:hypothetical protein
MQNLDYVAEQVSIVDQLLNRQRPQVGPADLVLKKRRSINLGRTVNAVLVESLLEVPAGLQITDDSDELPYSSGK